jgi:ParB family chromosome partitioning protein
MSKIEKIALSASRDIPFNKLILSQSNVRRIKAGVSIEELAEDIARRTLLQSITVRAVRDADGNETGMYEIPAGGRRYRALELLVKQKRLARTAPVPCVVREGGIAEEDSLAENIQRAPLHPLDQFRAFLALREKGLSEEEIAAAFFVSVAVVHQRLRLASVSPHLLEVYAEDGLTLDQLMAFTVSGDHERQEQVFERLAHSHTKEPYAIRRMLTEGAVRAADKRAQFIGVQAYEDAGGTVLRDLFQSDDGGWLQDVGLVDRLVAEKLQHEADAIRVEVWKWVEVAPEFPYGHAYGLRQLSGDVVPLTDEENSSRDALRAEYDRLEETYAEAEDLPEEVDQRLAELETALAAIEERPLKFDPADVTRAGAFISIDGDGCLRVERGYVRPEDELPVETGAGVDAESHTEANTGATTDRSGAVDASTVDTEDSEDENNARTIPDRLLTELTAHRTLALRDALGKHPDIAFVAGLHALSIRVFYRYSLDSCLEIDLKNASFGAQAPGLNDSEAAQSVDSRHQKWTSILPKEPADLWDTLLAFDNENRMALFAHCVSLSVNAVIESYNRRPRAVAHADLLAKALDVDIAVDWKPTVANYLGRVTKAQILDAVREARGEGAAQLIDHLKKHEMAEKAEGLLGDSGWLPEALRTPGRNTSYAPVAVEPAIDDDTQTVSVQTTVIENESAVAHSDPVVEDHNASATLPAEAAE